MEGSLGSLEELVLLAVCGLTGSAYAVPVQQQIASSAGRVLTMGAVYTTLDRLEKKGYLRSRLGEVTHERGGRRKRYYEVTGPGMRAIAQTRDARERLLQLIDPKLRPRLGSA